MSDLHDEGEKIDREAVASEVLVGCANTLQVLGFSDKEIAGLLRNTADGIHSSDDCRPDFNPVFNIDGLPDFGQKLDATGLWDLQDEYEASDAAKTLKRLDKRLSSVDLYQSSEVVDVESIKRAHEILLQALNARREAISWLQSAAAENNISVEKHRDRWRATATDEELDTEDSIVFLDDYQWSGGFQWGSVGRLSKILCEIGEKDLVAELSDLVLDQSIAIPERECDEVIGALKAVSVYDQFREFVRAAAKDGEVIQSAFIDTVERELGSTGIHLPVYPWLSYMASNGEIEQYKKSNRWRFRAR